MSISDRLDEIEARCESAYPAPWHRRGDDEYGWMVHGPERESFIPGVMQSTQVAGVDRGLDAEFIAHARTDVPELVAALRAVLGRHKRVQHRSGTTICNGCWGDDDGESAAVEYPCPTVRAIAATLGEES